MRGSRTVLKQTNVDINHKEVCYTARYTARVAIP